LITERETQLSEKEREELFEKLSDPKEFKKYAEQISLLIRAFDGRPMEDDSLITKLTDVKNILERSRFPTYPILGKQEYLRLIAKYNPQAQACKDWAEFEAQALISYKGQGREEYVDMTKSAQIIPETPLYLGEQQKPGIQQQPQKKGFWSRLRRPAKTESEFNE